MNYLHVVVVFFLLLLFCCHIQCFFTRLMQVKNKCVVIQNITGHFDNVYVRVGKVYTKYINYCEKKMFVSIP